MMMITDSFDFRPHSNNGGFQPSSINSNSGVGSFNSNSLARMESRFCKNFVCCSTPLDDLHDLLEHFEQAHCTSLSNPTSTEIHHSSGNPRQSYRQDVVFEDEDEWCPQQGGLEDEDDEMDFEFSEEDNDSDHLRAPSRYHNRSSLNESSNTRYGRQNTNRHHASLISDFHDSLGIPPALLDGQYRPPNPPVDHHHAPTISNSTRNKNGRHHHDHLGLNVIGTGVPGSIQQLLRLDEAASSNRVKDPDCKKRFADREWSEDHHQASNGMGTGSLNGEEKRYKCSVPGCEKSYKQQNGLKYHQAHGHSQRDLTPEEEMKTFVCHDEVCGKRYKNINGLRYHYQHTGPHGAVGLERIANGLHPLPPAVAGTNRGHTISLGPDEES